MLRSGRNESDQQFRGADFTTLDPTAQGRNHMRQKNPLIIGVSVGAGLLLLVVLGAVGSALRHPKSEKPEAWKQEDIKATYVASQLKAADKAHATLTLSYDLENNTDLDYRLTDGPGIAIMSRLKSDGSLSQEERPRLSYAVFLPARQRARIAIEITEPFVWPSQDDAVYEAKIKDFVKQRLTNVSGFVLFDEADRRQLELPSGWGELQDVTQASY